MPPNETESADGKEVSFNKCELREGETRDDRMGHAARNAAMLRSGLEDDLERHGKTQIFECERCGKEGKHTATELSSRCHSCGFVTTRDGGKR